MSLVAIKTAVKAFFGGGSTVLYALLGSGLIGAYLYVQFLEAANDKLKIENSQQAGTIEQLSNLSTTLSSKEDREKELNDKFYEAEREASKLPITNTTKDNPAMLHALDWLRNNPDTTQGLGADK